MKAKKKTAAPTIKPGIYPDIPIEDYHAGPGVSKSQLDLLDKAPALLEWSRNAPRDTEARAAVDIGHALHSVLLQPDSFDDFFVADFTAPPGAIVTSDDAKLALDALRVPYTAKDTKQSLMRLLLTVDPDAPVLESIKEQWALGAAGKMVLAQHEYRKVMLMRDSVMAHPFARTLLEAPGPVESSIYWIDKETGELCRCRPDKRAELGSISPTVDVKITGTIDEFWRAVEDYRYDVQDPFYTAGIEAQFGEPQPFIFLAVGSERDAGRYPVRCFTLPSDIRDVGANRMRANLNLYSKCRKSGQWPGVETVKRPSWARR